MSTGEALSPAHAAAALLGRRRVLSLATLGPDGPTISMAPYAWATGGAGLVIHISTLAAHARNLRSDPRCAWMVMQAEEEAQAALALSRLTVDTVARFLERDSREWTSAARAYQHRFPQSLPMFDFGDFHLVALQPLKARMVSGFAAAHSFHADALVAAMEGASPASGSRSLG